jgi:hypothetical protein
VIHSVNKDYGEGDLGMEGIRAFADRHMLLTPDHVNASANEHIM